VIDLLCCLLEQDGLSDQFYEWLKSIGVDPDVFNRCCAYCEKGRERSESASSAFTGLNLKHRSERGPRQSSRRGVLSDVRLSEAQRAGLKASFDTMLKENLLTDKHPRTGVTWIPVRVRPNLV